MDEWVNRTAAILIIAALAILVMVVMAQGLLGKVIPQFWG